LLARLVVLAVWLLINRSRFAVVGHRLRRCSIQSSNSCKEADPCVDSFALDEVGGVLLSTLRDWTRDSPTTAAPGITRSIIRFTVSVLPDPDHADTADTLEAMRDARLVLAHAVHYVPGAHR
jgi:hypothetical protein